MFEVVGVVEKANNASHIDSRERLLEVIGGGARFVVLQFCVAPLAFALVGFSPAILVLAGQEWIDARAEYDRISRLFGWSVFYGLRERLSSLRVNVK